MIIRLSRNRLYQVGAIAFLPIATYNYIVWFSNPDTKWETAYLKSFTGAITCTILSIVFLILSFTKQDKQIELCNRG